MSIQSLIMVPQPYFNEPGYESTMLSENGRKQDREYTANIREQTMHYAIQEQLRSPPRQFEDAVRTHFRHDSLHATACTGVLESLQANHVFHLFQLLGPSYGWSPVEADGGDAPCCIG